MKIAYVQPRLNSKGGSERVLLLFLKNFSKKHDIDILTSELDLSSCYDDFKAYKNNIRVAFSRRIPGNLRYLKSIKSYDLIIASSPAQTVAIRTKIPIIAYAHSPYRAIRQEFDLSIFSKNNPLLVFAIPIFAALEKLAFNKCIGIITNSYFTMKNLDKYNLLPENLPRQVIYPAVEIKAGKPKWKKYFLYISRIDPTKRQHLAIEAFNKVLENNPKYRNFKLILAGHVNNTNYCKYLESIKGPNIEILQNLSDKQLAVLYKSAYACLFCAKNEDFGITPVEAQSFGKMVLVLGEGGCKETIIDDKTGFFVKNTDEFSKKIAYLMENPQILHKAAPNCLKNVRKFSEKAFVDKFAKILEAFEKDKQTRPW